MQSIVRLWNKKGGKNIFQLAIPLNASRPDKHCTVLLQRHGSLWECGAIFSLMQPQTQKKEKRFWFNQFLV